jgi:hypothetical protein
MTTIENRPGADRAASEDPLATDHHQHNGHPTGLRATLKNAGGSLKAVTVLGNQNDPFRTDTTARHRDGAWLANTLDRLAVTGQRHLRGLHYILLGQPKPNGEPYTNTDEDWKWLGLHAAKAARWLGYIPFDRIVDQRNDAPAIREWTPPRPEPYVSVDFEIWLPDYDDLAPKARITGFTGTQPYHLVLVGEKSSLRDVLGGVADTYQADLYLPTGEISDTQAHHMAKSAVRDGRPLAVFYFADCDPSGWQMPISLARKLQAFKATLFPQLQFEMHRVALTPDQVRMYGLPSTPLKDTEKRADDWAEKMGVEQTEIDALAALQPDLLRQIADDAIAPFFDHTLSHRVLVAQQEWLEQAQARIDEQDGGNLEHLRARAADALDEKRAEIEELLDTVRVDADEFNLPEPVIPEAELSDELKPQTALCDSTWDFTEQCRRLITSKNYTE